MSILRVFLLTLLSSLIFTSCGSKQEEDKMANNGLELDEGLIIGSWEDVSKSALHFTLFEDGTAQSDNMKTLLYKSWSFENGQLFLVEESIGNKISSIDTLAYEVIELNENKLHIQRDGVSYEYRRSN